MRNYKFFFLLLLIIRSDSYGQAIFNYRIATKLYEENASLEVNVILSIDRSQWTNNDVSFYFMPFGLESKNSPLVQELLRSGDSDYYFRNQEEMALVSDFRISYSDKNLKYDQDAVFKEWINLSLPDSNGRSANELVFSYTLKLPKLINGLGLDNKALYLFHFYPVPQPKGKLPQKLKLLYPEENYHFICEYDITLETEKNYDRILSDKDFLMDKDQTHKISFGGLSYAGGVILLKENIEAYHLNLENCSDCISVYNLSSQPNDIKYQMIQRTLDSFDSHISRIFNNEVFQPSHILINPNLHSRLYTQKYKSLDKTPESELELCYYILESYAINRLADFVRCKDFSDLKILARYLTDRFWEDYTSVRHFRMNVPQNIEYLSIINAHDTNGYSFAYDISKEERKLYNASQKYDLLRSGMHLADDSKVRDMYQENINENVNKLLILRYIEDLTDQQYPFDLLFQELADGKTWFCYDSLPGHLAKLSATTLHGVWKDFFDISKVTDYAILDAQQMSDGIELKLYNKEATALPLGISLLFSDKYAEFWPLEGFIGEKTIQLSTRLRLEEIKIITLDPIGCLPEINRENNHFYPKDKTNRLLRVTSPFSENDSRYKELYSMPVLGYNTSDQIVAGLYISNSNNPEPEKWHYTLMPMYAFGSKSFVGDASFQYRSNPNRAAKGFYMIDLGFRSFNEFKFRLRDTDDYEYNRYIRVRPAVSYNKIMDYLEKSRFSITYTPYLIWDHRNIFSAGGIYIGQQRMFSHISRLDIKQESETVLLSKQLHLIVEYQQYTASGKQQYLRADASQSYRWMYKKNRNFYFRAYASAFIFNTRRTSQAFQNFLNRGTIALFHQGFNDYTYDDFFVNRLNQNQSFQNQVNIYRGGGFKTPLGSANSYGMSNDFAAALNFSVEAPLKASFFKRIQIYADIGTTSVFDFQGNKNYLTMWNIGLSYHVGDYVSLFIPLLYSSELRSNYFREHDSFLKRLSFSVNLNQFKCR